MVDLGQDRADWVHFVAYELILDIVATTAAMVDKPSVPLHRVDQHHQFVELWGVPLDFHMLLGSYRLSLNHCSRVFCGE